MYSSFFLFFFFVIELYICSHICCLKSPWDISIVPICMTDLVSCIQLLHCCFVILDYCPAMASIMKQNKRHIMMAFLYKWTPSGCNVTIMTSEAFENCQDCGWWFLILCGIEIIHASLTIKGKKWSIITSTTYAKLFLVVRQFSTLRRFSQLPLGKSRHLTSIMLYRMPNMTMYNSRPLLDRALDEIKGMPYKIKLLMWDWIPDAWRVEMWDLL